MPLVPGDQLFENYSQVLTAGLARRAPRRRVSTMLFNSLVMALAIALGKIAISIIASFAIVYFRFPLRNFFFWMIFVTLMLPVEVRIIPTFKVASDLGMLDSYAGPDAAADRLGHRDVPLPAVLPHDPRRARGGRAHRRRRAAALLLGRGACRCRRPAWPRSS